MVSEKELQKDLQDYQNLQQQLQIVMIQRQQLSLSQAENEKAQDAVKKAAEGQQVYRLAGSVLVPRSNDDLVLELSDDADSIKMRLDIMAKQEEKLKNSLKSLQSKFEAIERQTRGGKGGDLSDSASLSG
jgi:prefoldin beta subunit